MHSFISNSNDRAPDFNWLRVLAATAIFFIGFLFAWNAFWVSAGFPLEVKDTAEWWCFHRKRASSAGENAIVFVGASRLKAGIDLNEVKRHTGKIPIQLAIAGESPVQVLKNLAEDESFKGTVIVEISEYILYLEKKADGPFAIETWIKDCQENKYDNDYILPAKSFAKTFVASPNVGYTTTEVLTNIFTGRVFDENYLKQVVKMRPPSASYDRSSQGYLDRETTSELELRRKSAAEVIRQTLADRPPDKTIFLETVRKIEDYTRSIHSRGGKVILVNPPLDGEVKELNESYFPKKDYWNVLTSMSSAQTIYYADYPGVSAIETIDGIHLSGKNATLFTRELFKIISSKRK